MSHLMRLSEFHLSSGTDVAFNLAAGIYVAAGSIRCADDILAAGNGFVCRAGARVEAGDGGATLWCWEVLVANTAHLERGAVRLERMLAPESVRGDRVLRLDSVAFPPGGCAFLHTHQGPGIRCLATGSIRIDTGGTSRTYGPGSPWFEAGPEPVFAQADRETPTRFVRAMLLPAALAGKSSIAYVNEEDRDRPKSQSYRGFGEVEVGFAQ